MLDKKTQTGRYGKESKRKRRAPKKIEVSESQIQAQMNDMLEKIGVYYLRISDNFWSWFNQAFKMGKVPDTIYYPFVNTFKNMPDNICLIEINEKYNLACCVELKSEKGKKSKGQRDLAKKIAVQESRSPDDNIEIIQEFLASCKKSCVVCGCRISLGGYCAGCQSRV